MKKLNKIEGNINDYCVVQRRQWAIGNFIMCTPTIKALSVYYNKPINVYFETPVVSQMFEKCIFINIINKIGDRKVIFESNMNNQKIPDYEFIYNQVFDKQGITRGTIPHTYVDSYNPPKGLIEGEYILIIRGANHNQSPTWKNLKDVGHDIYRKIIDDLQQYDKQIVHIGNQQDYNEYIKPIATKDSIVIVDDIKKSLGCINGASTIIANDTGMYHAAGALDKHMFVMWKDTNLIKNMSPGNDIMYSNKGNWWGDYKTFNIK
jgi:hypothetical protein